MSHGTLPEPLTGVHYRARLHADDLRWLPMRDWRAYVSDRLRSLAMKATRGKPVRQLLRAIGPPHKPMAASRTARYGYNSPSYPGPVVVIRARQRDAYVDWDPMERWPAYGSCELTFLDVDGCHGNILHEPHVHQVAGHMPRRLDRAAQSYKPGA